MCELFGVSSRNPTRPTFSLEVFASHGAPGRSSVDGWGVAFYDPHEARDVRLYKQPEPAGDSVWLDFVERRGVNTRRLISHIRRATRGNVSYSNTQPFTRELAGRIHVFAHNGDVGDLAVAADSRFDPVGETDSEAAFCLLLDDIAPLWTVPEPPPLRRRAAAVGRFAAEMRARGQANFLYSDGDVLFPHGHRRIQTDGTTRPPGLWWVRRRFDTDHDALPRAGVRIAASEPEQDVVLIASVPITGEPWRPFGEGELIVVRDGAVVDAAAVP
jgi:glutamine amidotransferase